MLGRGQRFVRAREDDYEIGSDRIYSGRRAADVGLVLESSMTNWDVVMRGTAFGGD